MGYIVSVAVCGSEIFVLRRVDSGRRIVRLGFAPELTNGMFVCLFVCLLATCLNIVRSYLVKGKSQMVRNLVKMC